MDAARYWSFGQEARLEGAAWYREFMAIPAKLLDKKLAGDEGIKQVSEQGYEEMVGGDKSHKDHILQ